MKKPRVQQLERTETSFFGRYKQHDISIDREDGRDWYIEVWAPSGCHTYDGYWRDSQNKSLDEAIKEACVGSLLFDAEQAA